MHERANAGIDVHISDDDTVEFQRLAGIIDPNKDFNGVQGCQSCVNNLVKFVYDKEKTLAVNGEQGKDGSIRAKLNMLKNKPDGKGDKDNGATE